MNIAFDEAREYFWKYIKTLEKSDCTMLTSVGTKPRSQT